MGVGLSEGWVQVLCAGRFGQGYLGGFAWMPSASDGLAHTVLADYCRR